MMIYYCLFFLIGEVWLDLQNNILFRETSHNRSLGQAGWTLILGWHQKA